jgi:hypothetical protein
MRALDFIQGGHRLAPERSFGRMPEIQRSIPATGHDIDGRLSIFDQTPDTGTDQPDLIPEIAPIKFPVLFSENLDRTAGRSDIPGNATQKRGFARSVGAQNDPIFSWPNFPAQLLQDLRPPSRNRQGNRFSALSWWGRFF